VAALRPVQQIHADAVAALLRTQRSDSAKGRRGLVSVATLHGMQRSDAPAPNMLSVMQR
jgi:hypothetical protein